MKHSLGQIAYEMELALIPNYGDGQPRKRWSDLPDYAKASWEKNPSPRINLRSNYNGR